MRTHLADIQVFQPDSVEEALHLQAEKHPLFPIAGGTDVLVWMNAGKMPGHLYQSLHRLSKDWRYVRADNDGGLRIGALATYSDVRFNAHVMAHYPLLVESARVTGALQIQNRGTLVGNVANASPAADTVPVLLVYDAKLKLVSTAGERWIALSEFYKGYKKNAMKPGELIAEIHLPPTSFRKEDLYYRKVGTREAQAISKVVFAGARSADGKTIRMAWGSVAPVTLRSVKTEGALATVSADDAWDMLRAEIAPIDDIRSTAEYRLKVSRNILRDFVARTTRR